MALCVILTLLLASSTICLASRPQDSSKSSVTKRQSATGTCNGEAGPFNTVVTECTTLQCSCSQESLYIYANKTLQCNADAQTMAEVQYVLNAQSSQCRSEGFQVLDLRLPLQNTASEILEGIYSMDEQLKREQTAFLALQIAGGHVGLVILMVVAVFSNRRNRDPTYFNFCLTWLFSSIVFSLSLYGGSTENIIKDPLLLMLPSTPSKLCLTQAALTGGVQIMTTCSKLALVIQLWLKLYTGITGNIGKKLGRGLTITLVVAPYLCFLLSSFPALLPVQIDGVVRQRVGIPGRFYCMLENGTSILVSVYGVMLGMLILTLIVDACIICTIYRHWRVFRRIGGKAPDLFPVLVRVSVFSGYRVVVAVAYGSVLLRQTVILSYTGDDPFYIPVWVDMLQATGRVYLRDWFGSSLTWYSAVPLFAFFIFGFDIEALKQLTSWRKSRNAGSSQLSSDGGDETTNLEKEKDACEA
ncbi:hypothetical protein K439DRAFT_1664058 [Ramaria rubella]|nr:hypothetical protein K439DRAFT_1664058 [Ramaria rubella]